MQESVFEREDRCDLFRACGFKYLLLKRRFDLNDVGRTYDTLIHLLPAYEAEQDGAEPQQHQRG